MKRLADLTTARMAQLIKCPALNVRDNFPLIVRAMESLNVWSDPAGIASLATIAVETNWTFQPIKEMGGLKYLRSKKYYPFYGRGFAQLTWRDEYERIGKLIGVDLVSNPDAALEPNTAALIFAVFFRDKHVKAAADAREWRKVRKIWNGGFNGWDEFIAIVARLEGELLGISTASADRSV
jgi:predicted chitinase